jgi:hypothetical protein
VSSFVRASYGIHASECNLPDVPESAADLAIFHRPRRKFLQVSSGKKDLNDPLCD